jgi:hypothetical protein
VNRPQLLIPHRHRWSQTRKCNSEVLLKRGVASVAEATHWKRVVCHFLSKEISRRASSAGRVRRPLNARAPSSQDHRGARERTAPEALSLSLGDNRSWGFALAYKATTQAQCGNDQGQCQRNFLHRIPLLLTALCGSSATSRVFSSRSRRSAASSHQKEPDLHWTLH